MYLLYTGNKLSCYDYFVSIKNNNNDNFFVFTFKTTS